MNEINWRAVSQYLAREAVKRRDEANTYAVIGQPNAAARRDETALILESLSEAIKYGLT